jgi:probable HAF family extracellular repeat protein
MNSLTFKRVGFAVAVLLSGVAGNTWGQVQYTVTDLGTLPGGSSSEATGINNSGQVVGYCVASSGYYHGFLYSHGLMQDLGTLPNGVNSFGFGINDKGQVVGQAAAADGYAHAFLYDSGTMQDLGVVGGPFTYADSINDSGQIVGQVGGYSSGGTGHAFLYSGGTMQDLVPCQILIDG